MTEQNLEIGRKYSLDRGDGVVIGAVYRGAGDNPGLARSWPHEFITTYPFNSGPNETDSALSLRFREGGFMIQDNKVIPIPDQNGRFFYSNTYFPEFDNTPFGGVTTEQRKGMLKELQEAGL